MAKNLRKYIYMKCAWVCLSACLAWSISLLSGPFPRKSTFIICGFVPWGDTTAKGGYGYRKGVDRGVQAGGGSTEAGASNDVDGEECSWGWGEAIGRRGVGAAVGTSWTAMSLSLGPSSARLGFQWPLLPGPGFLPDRFLHRQKLITNQFSHRRRIRVEATSGVTFMHTVRVSDT